MTRPRTRSYLNFHVIVSYGGILPLKWGEILETSDKKKELTRLYICNNARVQAQLTQIGVAGGLYNILEKYLEQRKQYVVVGDQTDQT